MQYLSFEVILSSQYRNFRQVVGAIRNDQLVKTFLDLMILRGFEADGPFLLLLVTSNSGDFSIQSKMTIKFEMLRIAPQVFLYLGGRRVRGNIYRPSGSSDTGMVKREQVPSGNGKSVKQPWKGQFHRHTQQ